MERIPSSLPSSSADGEMAEVALEHGGERLAGAGAAGSHLHRRGHEFADGGGLRVGAAEGHFAEHVAFGENSGEPGIRSRRRRPLRRDGRAFWLMASATVASSGTDAISRSTKFQNNS